MVRTANLIIDIILPFIKNRGLIEGLAISDVNTFGSKRNIKGNKKSTIPCFDNLEWILIYNNEKIKLGGLPTQIDEPSLSDSYLEKGKLEIILSNRKISTFPLIGIPGSFLGIQSFYIILENFWRNLIKHNVAQVAKIIKDGKQVSIFLEVRDKEKTPFWTMKLWSNIEISETNIADTISKLLNEGIIDKNGQLIPKGWGTKEMLIAAAYLSGKAIIDIQTKGMEILKCSIIEEKYLSYQFELLKPLFLFICLKEQIELDQKSLTTRGVFISTPTQIFEENIIPTEYFIQATANDIQFSNGQKPLKTFQKNINKDQLIQFQDDNNLFLMMANLESEFAKKLLPNGIEKINFIIKSPQPTDEKFLPEFDTDEYVRNWLDQNVKISFGIDTDNFEKFLAKGSFIVMFDRHGSQKEIIYSLVNKYPNQIFWEPYGGGTYTAFTLQHIPDNIPKRIHLISTIITSALLKVVILDERIQQILDSNNCWRYGDEPEIIPLDCLAKMKIYIPQKSICSLENPVNLDLKNYISTQKPHLLSIHAGILDKLGKKSQNDVMEWIKSTAENMDPNIRRIIIHSGRGIPVNIPKLKVPFLGYTAIEHWVTSQDMKSKYALVQEFLSARGILR